MNKFIRFIKINDTNILIYFSVVCIILYLLCSVINYQNKYIEQQDINARLYRELAKANEKLEENQNILDETVKINNEYADIIFTDIQNLMSYIEPLKALDKKEYLKQYDNIISHYSNIYDSDELLADYYSVDEIYMLQKCVETETFGADIDSKINVACVLINRINSDKFPNDPISVVKQPNQFSYFRNEISDDTKIALEYAFRIEDTTDGCLYFHSNATTTKFNGAIYQFTDNVGHNFYK